MIYRGGLFSLLSGHGNFRHPLEFSLPPSFLLSTPDIPRQAAPARLRHSSYPRHIPHPPTLFSLPASFPHLPTSFSLTTPFPHLPAPFPHTHVIPAKAGIFPLEFPYTPRFARSTECRSSAASYAHDRFINSSVVFTIISPASAISCR